MAAEQLTVNHEMNIHLVPVQPDDAAEIQNFYETNVDFIARYNYGWPVKTSKAIAAKVQAAMEKIDREEVIEYIIRDDSNQLIGLAGFYDIDRANGTAFISYAIAEAQTGHGVGKAGALRLADYGFKELGFKKILPEIDPENVPSKKIAEDLGAAPVGQAYVVEENGQQFPNQKWEITRG